jgi:hypothetical protein
MLKRTSLISGAALLIALAPLVTGKGDAQDRNAPEPPSAALLVDTRCGFCHSTALLMDLAQRKLAEDGPEEMKAFLAGHHAPDAEARFAIFQFLLSAAEPMN